MSASRYTGPGRRGASRDLTDTERLDWQATAAKWHSAPPWTEQTLAENRAVQQMLVDLYEDGVALSTLAQAADWNHPKVAGVLHRARGAGLGTGSRRYIEPTPRPAKASFRRALTPSEALYLTNLYTSLPQHADGKSRGWNSEQGNTLAEQILSLTEHRVSLNTIGEHLGMTRQAVHSQISRFRRSQAAAA